MLAAFVLIAFGSAFFVLIVAPLDAKTPVEADSGTSSDPFDGPLSAKLSFAGAGLSDGLSDDL